MLKLINLLCLCIECVVGHRVLKELVAPMDLRDLLDQKERRVHLDQVDLMVMMDLLDIKVLLDPLDHLVMDQRDPSFTEEEMTLTTYRSLRR